MKICFFGTDRPGSLKAIEYLSEKEDLFLTCVCDSKNILYEFCIEKSIEVYTNTEISQQKKTFIGYDFGISYLFTKIIKGHTIKEFSGGIFNFHPAPLPEHKGIGGCCYALLHNYDYWGVTAHFVEETLDTGNIVEAIKFPISQGLTAVQLEKIIQKKLLELFKGVVNRLCDGEKLIGVSQKKEGHYYSRKDLTAAKKVSLEEGASAINQKINALWLPPYEGVYIEKEGKRFYLINKNILTEIGKLHEKNYNLEEKND